ncbi:MAG: hydantoinase B/oxoprolinase family protein, partial [Anaerolineae bacterium]
MSTTLPPAELEVFRHRVSSVAEEMGAALRRAAFSTNIKERLDYSCAVFDGHGRLVAQAAHIPVHVGALEASVAAALAAHPDLSPGDVVVLNDPFRGGSHLPDLTTVSVVAVEGGRGPVAILATRAHHADVGGAEPGSMPMARDLHGEGVVVPPVLLQAAGEVRGDIMALIAANSRSPEERRGDLDAQLATHRIGEERCRQLLDSGPEPFRARVKALLAYCARRADAGLEALPDGAFDFADVLDDDGRGDGPVTIRVRVTLEGPRLTADFEGTAPEVASSLNAPVAVTTSAVYYVVACLLGDTPISHGTFHGVEVRVPRGTVLNPRRPAPVAGGNVETSQRVVDVMMGALAQVAPTQIPAASQGTMNNLMVGGPSPGGSTFTYYETMGGGAGGGPRRPGAAAIQVHMTNTRNTPVEALEAAYPMRILRYERRRGSGGDGRHPGGDGLERAIEFLSPARVTLLTGRRATSPWGLAGGRDGARGENILIRDGR